MPFIVNKHRPPVNWFMMNLFCTTSLCRSWGTKWEDIPSSFERGPGKRENLGHVASLFLKKKRRKEETERGGVASFLVTSFHVSPFLVSSFHKRRCFPRGRSSLRSTRSKASPRFSLCRTTCLASLTLTLTLTYLKYGFLLIGQS